MPLSKNINTYGDVKAILDQIRPHGKGTYTLATPGKARNWMMRAYQFRRLYQEQGRAQTNIKGYTPPTDYDTIRLNLSGCNVNIDFAPEPDGVLTLPTGETLKPASAVHVTEPKQEKKATPIKQISDLEHLALSLAQEVGDED